MFLRPVDLVPGKPYTPARFMLELSGSRNDCRGQYPSALIKLLVAQKIDISQSRATSSSRDPSPCFASQHLPAAASVYFVGLIDILVMQAVIKIP